MSGCTCQQYGKTGVPHVTSWRCLVCGQLVDVHRPFVCPAYVRDEDADPPGSCRTCGDPAEEHTYAAQALGTTTDDPQEG